MCFRDNVEVAVVYMRSGYDEESYSSDKVSTLLVRLNGYIIDCCSVIATVCCCGYCSVIYH